MERGRKATLQVLERTMTKFGARPPKTLTTVSNLASTYWNQGRWDEAEELDLQILETRKTQNWSRPP